MARAITAITAKHHRPAYEFSHGYLDGGKSRYVRCLPLCFADNERAIVSNPWFRMYSEFSHDPKVQMLSEQMQRRYIMLMCLRCSNTLVTLHETEVAFHLRISNEDMQETKQLFIEKGFIDADWNLLNWEKRQFSSDRSAARVAKHRALQKEKHISTGNGDVTLQKQKSNALDTDTDTYKKKENAIALPSFVDPELWNSWVQGRKGKKISALAAKTAVNQLSEWNAKGLDANSALRKAVIGGHQGLYEPDQRAKKSGVKHVEDWFIPAGFDNVHEARNAGCSPSTVHMFHDGKKLEAA